MALLQSIQATYSIKLRSKIWFHQVSDKGSKYLRVERESQRWIIVASLAPSSPSISPLALDTNIGCLLPIDSLLLGSKFPSEFPGIQSHWNAPQTLLVPLLDDDWEKTSLPTNPNLILTFSWFSPLGMRRACAHTRTHTLLPSSDSCWGNGEVWRILEDLSWD